MMMELVGGYAWMIELGAATGAADGAVVVVAVICVARFPVGVVVVVVVRDVSLPESNPRNVSAMRAASALRRYTT